VKYVPTARPKPRFRFAFTGSCRRREFHTLLNLPERYLPRRSPWPNSRLCNQATAAPWGLGLRNSDTHVRVDQVADQSNTGGLARFEPCHVLGSGISNRGPSPKSTSFQVKTVFRLLACAIRQWKRQPPYRFPRRVTTCGPFSSVSSISSLKPRLSLPVIGHLVMEYSRDVIVWLVRWLVKSGLWLTV